jgi:ABC-type antimicrobial peptide transport system permease subunit
MLQSSSAETSLIVRSTRDPAQLAASVRKSLQEVDNALPVYTGAWTKELGLSLFPARMATVSLGILGIMGAMLSITGIFGMAAYSVSRRLKELGIRVALGAGRREILQSALGRAVRLLAIGATSGLVLGLLATRVLAAIVYQATPRDPLVLTGVVVAMGLIGLLATWIPAQRALSLDPIKLLHEE